VTAPAPEALNERLRAAGRCDDDALDLLDTALTLAALDRPRVALERYAAHLQELAGDLSAAVAGGADIDAVTAALRAVLAGQHDYRGDERTYDDMQNANLMRVIDRRRGLPVALGILYVGTARACGWALDGIRFPAHFLLRLELGGERRIIDPFAGGTVLESDELRSLLKRLMGSAAELAPAHFAVASPREMLLRLQNNIRTRAIQAGDMERAATVLQRMLLLAPQTAELHRDHAALLANRGEVRAALAAGERYRALAATDAQSREAEALLAHLRRRLN